MAVSIREERPADRSRIFDVICEAFGQQDEAHLVNRLRAGGYARLSLVAELDGRIVGHVFYSALTIETDQHSTPALALAPLSVVPEHQSRGIGTALVEQAHQFCRERDDRIVIVLGHPDYYPRFGFSAQLAKPLESPYAGDSFMALELVPGALDGVRGRVVYAAPFSEF